MQPTPAEPEESNAEGHEALEELDPDTGEGTSTRDAAPASVSARYAANPWLLGALGWAAVAGSAWLLVVPVALSLWTPGMLVAAGLWFPLYLQAGVGQEVATSASLYWGGVCAAPLLLVGVPLGMGAGTVLGWLGHSMVVSAGARLMGLVFQPGKALLMLAGGAGVAAVLQTMALVLGMAAAAALAVVVLVMWRVHGPWQFVARTVLWGGLLGALAVAALVVLLAPAVVGMPASLAAATVATHPAE